ncbi:MAG: DUF2177 family protein [Candidatus Saccharibacteria bacterium]
MKTTATSILASLITMLLIDGVWLTTMSKRFYSTQISHLMASQPSLLPAIIFYIIYAVALGLIIVMPAANDSQPYTKVFLLGLLFGLAAYGTYDLTNQATLKNWPTIVTIVDLAWGGLLTGTVAVIATYITKYFS